MLIMRRGDDDGIDFAGTNQFFAVGENFQAALFVMGEFFGKGVGNGLEFDAFDFAIEKISRRDGSRYCPFR